MIRKLLMLAMCVALAGGCASMKPDDDEPTTLNEWGSLQRPKF